MSSFQARTVYWECEITAYLCQETKLAVTKHMLCTRLCLLACRGLEETIKVLITLSVAKADLNQLFT